MTATGKNLLHKARAQRVKMGYDPSPPLCRNCKRFVPESRPVAGVGGYQLPFCGVIGQNVSPVAVCDFWVGKDGEGLV